MKEGEIIADPLFINYEERDLHLLEGSPAIDMAEASRYTFDLDGNQVPQGNAPDAGAYESSFSVSLIPCFDVENVSIYPNPSSGIIYLTDRENTKHRGQTITIHDLTGKVVKTKSFQNNTTTIDLANQSEGIYFVKVGLSTKKISIL
ncbi:hypothetical protein ES703_108835 [subsurface metagenome]